MEDSIGLLYGEVIFDVETHDINLNIDTAIPIGLLVNELISNCYKHAFRDSPDRIGEGESNNISIDIGTNDDGNYYLKVKDNGIGIPVEIDIHNTSTLGLQLVGMLVEQLNGSLELNRENGTEFHIVFQGRNASTMKN